MVPGDVDANGCPLPCSCVASKILGEWTNEGSCNGDGDDPTCGAGTQLQSRTCTDGTIDKCTVEDTHRSVTCAVAGTALPVCVTCPEGFVQYNRKCYKFSTEEATWDDARSACQSLSEDGAYDLVSIDSQELATALKQYPDHWIGLDDKLIEGAFTWVNGQGLGVGSTLGEDPWGANEPNDSGGNEDCVHLNSNGLWNDNKCSAALKYICGPKATAPAA
jgi:hypothetical protein